MIKFKNMFLIAALLLPVAIVTSCNNNDDDDINGNESPVALSTTPQNNTTNTERNIVVSATFSQAMDPTSINSTSFTLKQGASTIAGVVTYTGMVATFTPVSNLNAAELFTATVTTDAKSSAGMFLENNYEWSFTTEGNPSSTDAVNLGASGNYLILAKTAINNSGTSALTGDLGLSPAATSYITGLSLTDFTGYATSAQVTGQVLAADMADPTPITLTTAVENMITAYNDAAGRSAVDFLDLGTGNIGGKTLSPGIYKWNNTVTIPANVTISGSSTDVWIFQIAENLTISSAVSITLIGGAQASNIFWQVAGQATVGTGAHFEGIILSMTSITFQTGATLNGRLLAQTAVVLDGNALTKP
ncbi:MAG: hypothetical protein CVU09_07185 [Bacteroidetes bacterium HGW-Bacteroidetes-4]|jgi:hypothetical protein|nr:MAG: hypothetical protein CVU09_07185 [Bacteroidetes bacterium HGW-Bacteroidetes-4]